MKHNLVWPGPHMTTKSTVLKMINYKGSSHLWKSSEIVHKAEAKQSLQLAKYCSTLQRSCNKPRVDGGVGSTKQQRVNDIDFISLV